MSLVRVVLAKPAFKACSNETYIEFTEIMIYTAARFMFVTLYAILFANALRIEGPSLFEDV